MDIKVIAGDIAKVSAGAIIVSCFESQKPDGDTAIIDKALGGAISELVSQGEIKGKLKELTLIHSLGKLPSARVLVVGLGKPAELSLDKVRGAVASACRWLRKKGVDRIATVAQGAGVNGISAEDAAQAIAEGAILGLYEFRAHITKKDDDAREVKELLIVGKDKAPLEAGSARGKVLAEAVCLARDMVNEPGNFMTPTRMAETAQGLAKSDGLEITILERDQMAQMGMGALLAVAQGSPQPPRFIVLKYKGNGNADIDLALVGKGITFDSGGISIKPSEGMEEMKGDMAGGASVIAAIGAIARLKPKINVMAVIPATENMPSGSAFKPGDVITAMNGKTIEIISTDAEGRLILADALCYARKQGAKRIVDVATLTGACRIALGDVCTGVFGNNQELIDKVVAAGNATGELMWSMPMFEQYREQIKSDVADIKNAGSRLGGAITAAKFLAEFIDGSPWVHLDIAATSMTEKERDYRVKGATGVPVRTLVQVALSLANK